MLERILYYVFIIPLSRLPLWILYVKADFFYLLLCTILPYRKKIALQNIRFAFPELKHKEQSRLLRKNYRHISNILAESIKNLSISQKKLCKRMQLKNPEIFQDLYDKGKSVVIMSAHYANWEFFITAQNLIIPHRAIGIGKPLSEKFLNRKINALRERNGMKVVSADNYKEEIAFRQAMGEKMAILALADQAPKPESAYWTKFFNKETPFSFGAEFLAHQFNFAVVFVTIKKIKRGNYEAEAHIITETPKQESYASISEKYVRLLEKQIKDKAEDWLWTHKRWKHTIPENLEEQKQQHRAFFHQRFKKQTNGN
ncbi:MAG TPA: hypothetical protein ENN45_01530 [Bacteroidetes bacterium]|nr:hypothetical protein [Bacteroidota bacterium]